jgi:hypothetical protein
MNADRVAVASFLDKAWEQLENRIRVEFPVSDVANLPPGRGDWAIQWTVNREGKPAGDGSDGKVFFKRWSSWPWRRFSR